MATTNKRVLVSDVSKRVETLQSGDWSLTFNYEGDVGKRVVNVSVNGNKNDTQGYVNYSKTGSDTNVNFNNIEYDSDLVEVLRKEVADITKEV